ncbi:hydroxyisourate hydrolase [Acinetobacter puyangensis]|uniref:5-hydroxyisourate hydrolase n=1 Tax=Acinetobacter puyangensis TaxID=1096779 RepID=A0A240E6M2_9GAMM|nr:hydroxyisourate hydrolase [Acinetobacter puyangensis]SNX44418.1 5-hydroxyisourate hydrolase [Acinetobacter puyangensis]
MSISTHILDTNLGKPAVGVTVKLLHIDSNTLLGEGQTDVDGRLKDFGIKDFPIGMYQLVFDILPYFEQLGSKTFFPQVCLQFFVDQPNEHYHVPLLISPFAYSTYRGS